jgi:hypothetical protein
MRTRFGTLRVKAAAAVLAFALAAPALFALPASSGPYVCYKPDEGKSIYPWDNAAKWFDTTGSGATINRVPTTNDYVFLYSSKNAVNLSGKKPMVVTNGVHAATGDLEICDDGHGNAYVIGINVQNGGTMLNEGNVRVGNSGSGKTGGGRLTVESGGEWTVNGQFRLGCSSGTSWLNVNPGGIFSATNGKEFLVGYQYGSGIITNEGTMNLYDVFPGVYGTGVLVNKGNLTIERKLTIGRYSGSTGHVILESGSTLTKKTGGSAPIYVGFGNNTKATLECYADWALASSDRIQVAHGTNSTGRLVIGAGAAVGAANSVSLGEMPGSRGVLELRGGTINVKGDSSGHTILMGMDGDTTTGSILGWGLIGRHSSTLRIRFFGQVIADGEGEARDLNLAAIRTVGTSNTENLNGCGTNGWFAVNKGRLIYPRAQNCSNTSHPTIGDYPNRSSATVMNSFRYTLDKPYPEGTYYNFAELYAPDRTDIPAGLPLYSSHDVVAGVWRFGLSSETGVDIAPTPVSFTGMSITFRYDWREMLEGQSVYVYRHDGSANGSWTRIGKAEISSTANTITTDSFDASSETWNAGWFAVVAQSPSGTTVIFR